MPKYFVSYSSPDKTWAEWIAYVLEDAGYAVTIQAWDFRPGANFVLEMQRAVLETERTLLVVSPDYLKSQFTAAEWAAALAQDPSGMEHKLVPVVVRESEATGLLASIVQINLVGADEEEARSRLLGGISAGRAKPHARPTFPGAASSAPHRSFPGLKRSEEAQVSAALYMPRVKRPASDADGRRFVRQAFEVIRSHFQTALSRLADHDDTIECDFQSTTAVEFTAEIFHNGKSVCMCRIWRGGMYSNEGISYAEGRGHVGTTSCNEMLSPADCDGELCLSALLGAAFGKVASMFDLKHLTINQASDYLWRRFVEPLER